MKPVADLDLKDLLKEASIDLLTERRRGVNGKIKVLLIKVEDLAQRKARLTSELAKADESYKKALESIEKLKAGDWSVLQEDKEPAPQA